jgi:nucleotide-binding universal stress UspA family protein
MTTGTDGQPATARYDHVLVPLDGSDFSRAALPVARALAERFGATVQTVSAADDPGEEDALRRSALEAVGGDAARVHVVVGGDPATVIDRRCDELGACLVCMSTRGRGRIEALLGSVASAVVHRTREPIVAVGPRVGAGPGAPVGAPAPLSAGPLTACVDGSAASESLLPVAAGWAVQLGLPLTVLTVAEPVPEPMRPGASWRRTIGPDGVPEDYVGRLAEQWATIGQPVQGKVVYDPVSAADGVVTAVDAEPTALLAVTTHARAGIRRAALGSVATAIVHRSTVPVLVVPLPA